MFFRICIRFYYRFILLSIFYVKFRVEDWHYQLLTSEPLLDFEALHIPTAIDLSWLDLFLYMNTIYQLGPLFQGGMGYFRASFHHFDMLFVLILFHTAFWWNSMLDQLQHSVLFHVCSFTSHTYEITLRPRHRDGLTTHHQYHIRKRLGNRLPTRARNRKRLFKQVLISSLSLPISCAGFLDYSTHQTQQCDHFYCGCEISRLACYESLDDKEYRTRVVELKHQCAPWTVLGHYHMNTDQFNGAVKDLLSMTSPNCLCLQEKLFTRNHGITLGSDIRSLESSFIAARALMVNLGIEHVKGNQQGIFLSAEQYHSNVPIVFDTGASISVTPFIQDFISKIVAPDSDTMSGLSDNSSVTGMGTVEWVIRDPLGNKAVI